MVLPYTDLDMISTIFKAQKEYFRNFKTSSVEFRKKALSTLKESIITHEKDIKQALFEDLGRPPKLSDITEIQSVLREIDLALDCIDDWIKPQPVKVPDFLMPSRNHISHEPYGVCYIIGPFNYPFMLTMSPLIGAIMGGNTAIIKPSENVPNISNIVETIIDEVFDKQYIAVVQGGIKENTHLLALDFDFIFFTGSPEVGKIVMTAAAKHLTPVILELGGKSPLIVLHDADVDKVVESIVYGKFQNSGQTCVAPDYMCVHEDIKHELMEKLVTEVKHAYPKIDSTGKLVDGKQVNRLKELLDASHGDVLLGGDADSERRVFSATIVDNVKWDDSLMSIELFGPILPIISFDSIVNLISNIRTQHPNPLACYVFTQNTSLGENIISSIPSGDAQVNGVLSHVASPYLPFGGVKGSGMGKYHGYYSFLSFTHSRSIRIVD